MSYNLTQIQKSLARWIVRKIREHTLGETFQVSVETPGELWVEEIGSLKDVCEGDLDFSKVDAGTFDALVAEDLLFLRVKPAHKMTMGSQTITLRSAQTFATVRGRIYQSVDTNFAEEEVILPVSALAQPHPPEIAMPLDRLRAKFPDPKKLGFLIMRFTAAKPFARIVEALKMTAAKHDVIIIRADENEFHADLWGNVRTHLHGCGFGVAVYERIETDEPNANVGLEVGYLMAMNKPVLLLKDRTVETLQADLAGKLYKPFDPHDPENTIPAQFEKWLEDNGIIVPNRP